MGKKLILIVDDDRDIIESFKVTLEANGYEISFATSKDEALKKLKLISPDLIILDVMMAKMSDGFDLSRQLKADDKYKDIPILMLTAVGKKTGFMFSADAGDEVWLPVDDYVEKPVTSKHLIALVEKLLNKDK